MNNRELIEQMLGQLKAQHDEGYRQGRAHGLTVGAACGALVAVSLVLLSWLAAT